MSAEGRIVDYECTCSLLGTSMTHRGEKDLSFLQTGQNVNELMKDECFSHLRQVEPIVTASSIPALTLTSRVYGRVNSEEIVAHVGSGWGSRLLSSSS